MKNKKIMTLKKLTVVLAMVLVFGLAITTTIAWLTDTTDPVVNTFTYGDINIELTETETSPFKILPGNDIPKDPKVTVKANSEALWLFVKVEKANWPVTNPVDKVNYKIATGWTPLPDEIGVYFREVDADSADTSYEVLMDNEVTVSTELTKAEVNHIDNAAQPTLTFTAYAVQRDGINLTTAAAAWAVVNP